MQDKEISFREERLRKTAELPLVSFEELARQRKLLQEFCKVHLPSLAIFAGKSFPIFKLVLSDPEPTEFRHITSTATCYASVATCPHQFRPEKIAPSQDFSKLQAQFAQTAMGLPITKWVSDGKAGIYCSCRGLPYVLSVLDKWDARIDDHIARIFYQLDERPDRFAIGEADRGDDGNKEKEQKSWYRPNAYHTYWTLELLRTINALKNIKGYVESETVRKAFARRDQLHHWARQQLGVQVALHSAASSVLDSDQLAWALTIVISKQDSYQSNLAEQDFIRQALKCLFETQEKVGTWRHYAPLFHYPNAGNAYCYVFETFATLLTEALKPKAEFVRSALKPYFQSLVHLWEYAKSTRTETKQAEQISYAWSSGHRNEPALESWATASVFAYAQSLRRLVGIWTREAALSDLNYRTTFAPKQKAAEKLTERSDIWGREGFADSLWSMFINHVDDVREEDIKSQERTDPDLQPIGDKFLRSAILYGPPGTSKTTLVRAIAGCLGWDYVELHASHFVAEGLTDVQSTADFIFRKLMELDHCVVLFDEIDELVRERDVEPDAFGRFLTTSMLPKLAELWEARKIMYFIATNHIEYFDRAVTRSQRFDAIIFMAPPSFDAKKNQLMKTLKEVHGLTKVTFAVERSDIEKAKPEAECNAILKETCREKKDALKAQAISDQNVLFKFALLRFDELGELALHLRSKIGKENIVTSEILQQSLLAMKDGKWRNLGEYARYLTDPEYERRDFTKNSAWVITNPEDVGSLDTPSIQPRKSDGVKIMVGPIDDVKKMDLSGYEFRSSEPGKILITKKKKKQQSGSKKSIKN